MRRPAGGSRGADRSFHEQFAWPVDADLQYAWRIELVAQRAQKLDDRGGIATPAFGGAVVIVLERAHRDTGFSSYTDEKSTSRAT